jgi:hypothetical protein
MKLFAEVLLRKLRFVPTFCGKSAKVFPSQIFFKGVPIIDLTSFGNALSFTSQCMALMLPRCKSRAELGLCNLSQLKQNFQEEIPLKLKSLLVITLFVVACSFASAQTFGFASTGGAQYCNYEQLASAGTGFYGGADNLSACGDSINATISGFLGTVKNEGSGVFGAGVTYGDTLYATLYGETTAQWTVFSKLKANKVNKFGQITGAYSWIGVAGFSGEFGGDNLGFLTASIPGRDGNSVTKGASVVNHNQNHKK